MVRLHAANSATLYGNASHGAGPASGIISAGTYGGNYYYSSWNVTGSVQFDASAGSIIKVQGGVTIQSSGSIQVDMNSAGANNWGGAANGTSGGAGGAACLAANAANRINSFISTQLWGGYGEPGAGYHAGASLSYGSRRLTIVAGGPIEIVLRATVGPRIDAGGSVGFVTTGSWHGGGGGGGGLVCLISGCRISFNLDGGSTNPTNVSPINCCGGNGGNGSASYYGGGGGGGGGLILMAPVIDGDAYSSITQSNSCHGGSGGTSTATGAGNGGGGGGSFGAGGNGGSSGHAAGYAGSDGQLYVLNTHPFALLI